MVLCRHHRIPRFKAYDGEYKVMGLAYMEANTKIRQLISKIIKCSEDGVGYLIDPSFIHYGKHSFSDRYTDQMVELFGKRPRKANETIERWHKNSHLVHCTREV